MAETVERDHADVVVMPPVLYLGALVFGVVAKLVFGGSIAPDSWIRRGAGLVLLFSGLAISVSFALAFKRAGQDKSPRTPTPSIVTEGLYRFSRNPAYLGLTMLLIALGLLLDNAWILASVIPVLAVMHFGVVRREEIYLEQKFGEEYRTYKARVRRWL